jgi:hypothetical protein
MESDNILSETANGQQEENEMKKTPRLTPGQKLRARLIAHVEKLEKLAKEQAALAARLAEALEAGRL